MLTFLSLLFWLAVLAFFWTYFGYPLLMYWRARSAPSDLSAQTDQLLSLTLLIPAHNEADIIQRKLENAVSLSYPRDLLQILVVDDGSTDGTVELIQPFLSRGVTLLQQPARSGKMAAVNTGFTQATGEIVVLSDASPSYEAHSLQVLARRFADPTVGVVVGTLAVWDAVTAVAKPAGLYWRYEAALRRWESKTGSTVAVHGNMFAVRRTLFCPLQTGTINDEFSIAMEVLRQGYRVVYEPDAISYDDASTSMADEFNRRARINAGRYQALFSAGYLRAPTSELTFRLFSHKLLRPLTPVLMLLILVLNVLLVLNARPATDQFVADLFFLRGLWGWLLLAGQCAFYGLAVLGWLAERQGKRNRILNVIYFFVSSNLAALVGLWRWLRGSQRVTWQKRTVED